MASPPPEELSPPAKDPVLYLRRDHTMLEMLAEGFRHVAKDLSGAGELDLKRIASGLEVHRNFLIETHHRRERVLDSALAELTGRPYASELATCQDQHARARAAAEGFSRDFERLSAGDSAGRAKFGAAMEKEADRWMEHHRWEEDHFYRRLHEELPREVSERIAKEMTKIRGESSGIEERLVSWTSSLGPSSD